jgi:hypothetical protein
MRSQQIGFGENLAKRPRAVACLKRMRSEEQAVKLIRARALNARPEARETTNSADVAQALAAEAGALTNGLIDLFGNHPTLPKSFTVNPHVRRESARLTDVACCTLLGPPKVSAPVASGPFLLCPLPISALSACFSLLVHN